MQLLDRALPGLPLAATPTFTERPAAVDGGDRLRYRLSLLVLSLSVCKKQTGSYARLALLNFAARSSRLRAQLLRHARNISVPSDSGVRFDPLFPRVISLACAFGLIEARQDRSVFMLSAKGRDAERTISENGLFAVEREFFGTVCDLLPELAVNNLVKGSA